MEYNFTAYTDSSSASTTNFNIIVDIGKTIIQSGLDSELNLYVQYRMVEFFSSDEKIIVKYKKEYFTDAEYSIEVILPNQTNSYTLTTEGDKFTLFDSVLGQKIRKLIVNGMLENLGVIDPDYFDQNELLNAPSS